METTITRLPEWVNHEGHRKLFFRSNKKNTSAWSASGHVFDNGRQVNGFLGNEHEFVPASSLPLIYPERLF